jgi:hypothetical protein
MTGLSAVMTAVALLPRRARVSDASRSRTRLMAALETTTTTTRAADVLLGFIVGRGHWGMAVVDLGLAFSVVAFVTHFDLNSGVMSAPEFVASLAFSAVLVTAESFIHVIELRHGWVDPCVNPVTGLSADGEELLSRQTQVDCSNG